MNRNLFSSKKIVGFLFLAIGALFLSFAPSADATTLTRLLQGNGTGAIILTFLSTAGTSTSVIMGGFNQNY